MVQEHAYQHTAERIFPVAGDDSRDITAVLLAEAREKLATAQAKQQHQWLLLKQEVQLQQVATQQQEQSSTGTSPSSSSTATRAELKVHTDALLPTDDLALHTNSNGKA